MNEKQSVREFKKKFKIRLVNSNILEETLMKQGYTLIEFNGVNDSEDVRDIVDALNLSEYIRVNRCFTYYSDKHRLIFINENLNEDEKTVVLSHEQGHIWNGHLSNKSVIGHDVIEEYQANEFSHYLLKDKSGCSQKRTIILVACLLMLCICIGMCWFLKNCHEKAVYTENLFRTETGAKYHIKDCIYIKNKTDVYRLTKEEFDSGEFDPCEACMPNRGENEE